MVDGVRPDENSRIMPSLPSHDPPPPLTSDEIDRYARHLVLRDVGGPGPAEAESRSRPRDRRRGPRRAPDPVSRGCRDRHDRDCGRRHGVALEPPAAGAPWDARTWAASRRRARGDAVARLNPHVRVEPCIRPGHAGDGPLPDRGLRHRGRRLGQFRHSLRRVRRLLPCRTAARDRGAWASSTAR